MLADQLICNFELAGCAIDGSPGTLMWNNGVFAVEALRRHSNGFGAWSTVRLLI